MKNKKIIFLALFIFFLDLSLASAYSDYSPGKLSRTNNASGSGRKLGRGVSNLLLGWVEVPRGVEAVGRESGFAASLSWGVLQGAGTALARTGAGVVDIVTFPFSKPNEHDQPLIEPEYIL